MHIDSMKEKKANRKIVYIADDDRAIVEALVFMLTMAGYAVDSAYDASVVEKIDKLPPDLLLLDIWMSGTNGADICKTLRKRKSTRHIPIIMISANSDTRMIAQTCGADDYVPKPFEVDELLAKIKNLIEKRPLQKVS
jgi:DNA-binding response OmpR family regulator